MTYWKGLMIAAAIDLGWVMGCPVTAIGPEAVPPLDVVADWPQPIDELTATGRLEDSLMVHLQENPQDVDAMLTLARIYADHGWYDAAINPLARALQVEPKRRSLWVALDETLGKLGKAKITDVELTERAEAFVEAVEMRGHGC
jgi:cytochrome c-type biogenesis protein CcmH/NrfG